MNPFHLNLGHAFAQPYESYYAMLRRCLIANPGIPLTTIQTLLRKVDPDHGSLVERISVLQLSSDLVKSERHSPSWANYRRQCPECAKYLYHTDIYALPWLTRCPLHHCAFTHECPVCHQPWPDMHELATRSCPGCGRLSLDQLDSHVLPRIRGQDYQPIADIYDLIARNDVHHTVLLLAQDDLNQEYSNWWCSVAITSSSFPSLLARHPPTISEKKLKSLNIHTHESHQRSARLSPIAHVNDEIQRQMVSHTLGEELHAVENNPPWTRMKADFMVMQAIAQWIAQHTSRKHHVNIASYRYLSLDYFLDAPDPCPYCLALSLWFFHTSARLYGKTTNRIIDDYPFCTAGRLHEFFSGCVPYAHCDGDYFKVDSAFAAWFYRRGLEISFVDMLRFAFDFLKQVRLYRENTSAFKEIPPYQSNDFPERLCSFEVADGRIHFYYENEHPLDNYIPERISSLEKQCQRYQKFHNAHRRDRNKIIIGKIPEAELSFDIYCALQNDYAGLLRNIWDSYGN